LLIAFTPGSLSLGGIGFRVLTILTPEVGTGTAEPMASEVFLRTVCLPLQVNFSSKKK
jgi:hypothetical protein